MPSRIFSHRSQRPITPGSKWTCKRADAGREIDDAGDGLLLQPLVNDVDLEAQFQIEMMRAEFDQEITVTRAADDDRVIALAEGIDETANRVRTSMGSDSSARFPR